MCVGLVKGAMPIPLERAYYLVYGYCHLRLYLCAYLRTQARGEGGCPGYRQLQWMAITQSRATNFPQRGWGIEEKGTLPLFYLAIPLF